VGGVWYNGSGEQEVVDDRVMKEFGKRSRDEGWWAVPGEMSVGDAGQANLLQAQVSSGLMIHSLLSKHVCYQYTEG
jgi:hypothetical protein